MGRDNIKSHVGWYRLMGSRGVNRRALAFGQYILILCYKQPISIYNVGKIDEDFMWWPY